MEKVLVAVGVVVVSVILSKFIKCLLVTKPKKLKLPPGPWTLPLIGSLHHLISNPLQHRAMRDLAQKHGPLMMLWLGELPTVVVSSPEAAQAITKTHDITFAERHNSTDRHRNTTVDILSLNGVGLLFGSYGERWRQLRKLCMQQLMSTAHVHSFQPIREEEVARFMQSLATSAAAGTVVDLSKMISSFVNDTFVRESIGSRCKYQDEYLDALDTAIGMIRELSVANIFPSSRVLQNLSTAPRRAMACRDRMTRIIEQIIRETKEAMDRGDKASNESLILVLLRLQKEASLPIELTDDIIMALMLVSRARSQFPITGP